MPIGLLQSSKKAPAVRTHRSGFTLVEVCMAIGIMSVTLIPLLGVMAIGVGQVASNIDNNQAVNISQQVFTEARQMKYNALSVQTGYCRYFSAQGDDLGTTTGTTPSAPSAVKSQVAYTAIVTITSGSSATPMTLPGGDAAQSTLVTLSVKVVKTPSGIYNSTYSRAVSTFVGMVSCEDLDYSGNSGI